MAATKILLLSCATGEGHNRAARAIAEEALAQGKSCDIADPLAFRSDRVKNAASSIYNGIIKSRPKLFGAIYKVGAIYSSTGLRSPVYYANASYTGSLSGYIDENKIETVICTHLFGMEAMTALSRKNIPAPPSFGVLTDYTCIPFTEETGLNHYFIGHEDMREELVAKGIPSDKITASGIPVSPAFSESVTKEEARERLGIAREGRVVLVMSGGVGCETMLPLCDAFAARGGVAVYFLTGHNDELRARVEGYPAEAGLHAVPFTDEVPLYMRAADGVITKSGGLSSTEAAVSGVPLVHLMTIPGCETKNAEFFASRGMSRIARTAEEAARAVLSLLDDPAAARAMVEAQSRHIPKTATKTILKIACGD